MRCRSLRSNSARHYRQSTGNEAFDLRASESLVDGKLAVVRCTGPAELKGKCLALYFVKTDDGWRNHSLRATTQDVPLPELMRESEKANPTGAGCCYADTGEAEDPSA